MDVLISTARGSSTYHDTRLNCPYAKRIKKRNAMQIPENLAKKKGYCGCKYCTGIRATAIRYKNYGYDCFYDSYSNSICLRTDVGFWKAIWYDNEERFHLFHMNGHGYKNFNPTLSSRVLVAGRFHRQTDFPPTAHFNKIVKYIVEHDKSKKIIQDDYRKMPQSTPKQKKYYNQAKRRHKKNSLKRLDYIFKQLEKEKCENG